MKGGREHTTHTHSHARAGHKRNACMLPKKMNQSNVLSNAAVLIFKMATVSGRSMMNPSLAEELHAQQRGHKESVLQDSARPKFRPKLPVTNWALSALW